MVRRSKFSAVLLLGIILVTYAMYQEQPEYKQFTGVCVYSNSGFSVLSDGRESVGVYRKLELGGVYLVKGRFYNTSNGRKVRAVEIVRTTPDFPLERVEGAYWKTSVPYILTPKKIELGYNINAPKGAMVEAEGIFYHGRFYPVRYSVRSFLSEPKDGMPWKVKGTVLSAGRRTVIWNGSEEIYLYPPYRMELQPGEVVEAMGITRLHSGVYLFVDSPEDIERIGTAPKVPIKYVKIGEIGVGRCMVLRERTSLKLNCTRLRLYGFKARPGDVVEVNALRRKSSLLCLNCTVVKPREEMSNGICRFSTGKFARIAGRVEWIRVYRNGFGIANVSKGHCWVLLKLSKALRIGLTENQSVTAYGTFVTYRGMPAFEVESGDDVCSGNC